MADLPDDPAISSLSAVAWDLDNFLDFSISSPNIFSWQNDEPSATLSEEILIPPLVVETLETIETQNLLQEHRSQDEEPESRIRKRDPRLICENFLAGRVPCACPEMENEEEEDDGSRKRAKVVVFRCQVPSCEADISHLKGYHKRHRVCLRCVNSATVMLDDVPQRYCQQCGKFHLLPDFDEGKRSCRRKLEKHNDRRRKPVGGKVSVKGRKSRTESPLQNEDVEADNDGKSGQESKSLSSLGTGEKQASSGSEGLQISEVEQPYKDRSHLNNVELRSADVNKISNSSRPVNVPTELEDRDMGRGGYFNDRETKFVENTQPSPARIVGSPDGEESTYAEFNQQTYTGLLTEESSRKDRFPHSSSGWNRRNEGTNPLRSSLSSTGHEKQISYTSVCPTGRISFKLYDWNPAEFPRRLRQQILQWLANMPIELEGYIRPGCTILTAFIALPQYMWEKLSADSRNCVCELINGYESILSGRGNMLVYMNNIVMQIKNGEASLVSAKMNQQVPKLYSVHPVFIEAGRPIEIVVCGKNLFQSKFRFLISFGGNYLRYDKCESIPLRKVDSTFRSKENVFHESSHEAWKIFIPSTDSRLFGPAFVEVENESGISNFIPILIADKQICSEFQSLEQELMNCRFCSKSGNKDAAFASPIFNMHEKYLVKRQSILELLLDVAWVIKDPEPDDNEIPVNHAHIQRLNCLFSFLINGHVLSVLEKILHSPKVIKILKGVYGKSNKFNDADVELLQNHVEHAWKSLGKKIDSKSNTNFQQFLEKVVVQGLPSSSKCDSKPGNQQPYECYGESQEIEDTRTGIKPSSALETGDARVLSVEESIMSMPLLEKEICSDISTEFKHNSKLGVRKMIDVVVCGQMIKIDLKRDIRVDRRIFLLTITFLAVCAGICVVLQHPHQVMEISMSVRRCLFRIHKDEVASDP